MEKILLVEDDPFMLKSLERLLSSRGFEVVSAKNGMEALDKANENEFALVISDVRMPGIDGIETLGKLKEVQPHARKIIITGYAEEEAPIRAIQLSVDDYLKKPFGSEILYRSIESALSRFRLEREKDNLLKNATGLATSLLNAVVSRISASLPGGEGRIERMVAVCARLGEALQLGASRLDLLRRGVLAHDLGYLTGRFTGTDAHGICASEILAGIPGFEETADLLLHHHDSTRRGIEGEILHLAEDYENLVSGDRLDPEEAWEKLGAGGHAARLVEALSREAQEDAEAGKSGIRATPGNIDSLLRLARTYTLIGETEMGRAALEKVREQGSLSEKADFHYRYLLISSQNLIRKGRFDEGLEEAEKAVDLAVSGNLGELAVARALLEVAVARLFLEKRDGLQGLLVKCEGIFERFQDAWNRARANLYLALLAASADGNAPAPAQVERCRCLIPGEQWEEWIQTESFALKLPGGEEIRRAFLPGEPGAAEEFKVYFLGPLRIYRHAAFVKEEAWKTKKVKLLFAYLLFNLDRPVAEEKLFDLLWPETDFDRARKNLHHTVYVLRRALEPDLAEGNQSRFIVSRKTTYQFNKPDVFWWDVNEIKKCFQQGEEAFAKGEEEKGSESLAQVLHLYQGELLEEFLEDSWCQAEREKIREMYFKSLLKLAEYQEKRGNPASGLELVERILSQDPLHEQAALQKIRLLFKGGQRSEAIRRYHEWCDLLKRELNLAPPPDLLSLYLEMTGG